MYEVEGAMLIDAACPVRIHDTAMLVYTYIYCCMCC